MRINNLSSYTYSNSKIQRQSIQSRNVTNRYISSDAVSLNFKANQKLAQESMKKYKSFTKAGIFAALATIIPIFKEQQLTVKKPVKKEKAGINNKSKDGYTKLIRAAGYNDLTKVKELCQYTNLNPNIQDNNDRTALHIAAENGYTEIVKELLKLENLAPNIRDRNGDTALHLAACWGYTKIVKELLKKENIDLNIQDNDGWTASDWAKRYGHTEIVRIIEEAQKLKAAKQKLLEVYE